MQPEDIIRIWEQEHEAYARRWNPVALLFLGVVGLGLLVWWVKV